MTKAFQSPLVNILLFSVFWALEIFITKVAFLEKTELIPFTLQSSFVTFLIISVYILFLKRRAFKKLTFNTLLWILFANAIHMGIGGFLGNAGIQLTTAVNAGFLSQFTVVTGTFLAWIILKERLTLAKIITVIMIVLGAFFLTTKGKMIIPHTGDLLIILACVAWALGGIFVRKILKKTAVSADIISFFRPIAGIPVILFFTAISPIYPPALQKVFHVNIFMIHQPQYIILNAIFVALVWIFVNRSLKVASASYVAIIPSITSIIVAWLALLFLNEKLVMIQYVGIALILASSFVAQYLKFDKH